MAYPVPHLIQWIVGPPPALQGKPEETHYDIIHTIQFDNQVDDLFTKIISFPKCPQYYTTQGSINPYYFVVALDLRQDAEAPNIYYLKVTYSNKFNSEDKTKLIPIPMMRPMEVERATFRTREVFEQVLEINHPHPLQGMFVPPGYLSSLEVKTTAGEPLILEDDISYRVFRCRKNVSKIAKEFDTELDLINEDKVTLFGNDYLPETLWLSDLTASTLQFENGYAYYVMNFSLYCNPKRWIKKLRNAGFLYRANLITYTEQLPAPPGGFLPGAPTHVTKKRKSAPKEPVAYGQPTAPALMEKIQIGDPKHYPSHAIPLRADGGLFVDPVTNQVLADGGVAQAGMTNADWKSTILEFRTRKKIKFNGLIPLK